MRGSVTLHIVKKQDYRFSEKRKLRRVRKRNDLCVNPWDRVVQSWEWRETNRNAGHKKEAGGGVGSGYSKGLQRERGKRVRTTPPTNRGQCKGPEASCRRGLNNAEKETLREWNHRRNRGWTWERRLKNLGGAQLAEAEKGFESNSMPGGRGKKRVVSMKERNIGGRP